uniref:Uncharacterized protein n=1 Tax=Panagrellus redivivus TaxID=6233 RepID=A0A7E4VQN2_PANRE
MSANRTIPNVRTRKNIRQQNGCIIRRIVQSKEQNKPALEELILTEKRREPWSPPTLVPKMLRTSDDYSITVI